MSNHRTQVGAERRLRTRRKLLLTAFQLLSEHGIDEPIIDLVVKQAGLSRGTFYNHFSGERELFLAVVGEVSNDIVDAVNPQVLIHDNPAVRIACGVTLSIKLACRYPIIAAFLVKGGSQAVFAGGSAIRSVERDVQLGLATGLFTIKNMNLAMDLVLGPVLCTISTLWRHPLDEAYIRALVAAILRSLGMQDQAAAAIAEQEFGEPTPGADSLFSNLEDMPRSLVAGSH